MTLYRIEENDLLLAKKILHESIKLKPQEKILIHLTGYNGISLLRALTSISRSIGAIPFVHITDDETQKMLIEKGDEAFWENQTQCAGLPLIKQMDAYVGIRASKNIYEESDIDPKQHHIYTQKYVYPVHFQERVKNTRWMVLRYPSETFASNARMATAPFTDFYYRACLFDYKKFTTALQPLIKRLQKTKIIHLKGEHTNIQFSVEGQPWIPCYGTHNIPDGELFTSPILDSVNGTISYAPSVYQGKSFSFVKLNVKHGVVTSFDSDNNTALEEILSTDDGAKRFGEFSFGLNPIITYPIYDTLFDEKIYGSNHLTLGNDYDEAPNGNNSSIHWDLICIGADVYLDHQLIRKGRLFITPDLEPLNPTNLLNEK